MKLKHALYWLGCLILVATSCKKTVTVGKDQKGKASSAFSSDDASGVSPEDLEGEIAEEDPNAEPPKNESVFTLTKFIVSRSEPELASIKSKIDEGATALTVGDKTKFQLATNMHLGVPNEEGVLEGAPAPGGVAVDVPADEAAQLKLQDEDGLSADSGEEISGEPRMLKGMFWLRGYMFDKPVKNIDMPENQFLADGEAIATLDKLNIELVFRYLGVDVSSRTITAGFDQSFTRDNDLKIGANLVVVGAEASVRMGGEVGMKAEFGVRRDNVVSFVYAPRINQTAGVAGVIKVLAGVGEAGPVGLTKMMELVGRGSANLGLVRPHDILYADLGFDGGKMVFTDGKVDIEAKSLGRVLWRKNVWDPAPLHVQQLPIYGSIITKFKDTPNAEACANAANQLKANQIKLTAYSKVIDELDQPVILGAVSRMGKIIESINGKCGG